MEKAFQRLCRTCLYTSKNMTEFISINTIDPLKKISTRTKIEMCIPEIEVEDPDSTFLCIACWNALNASYNFKCVCLATEEKLRKSICQIGGDLNKYFNKDILNTEIDLLLDDILTTKKTRTDLYRQAKFFLETQKVIKQFCDSQRKRTFNTVLKEHNPKANKLSNHITNKTKLKCKKCCKEYFDSKRYKCHVHRCGQYVVRCKKCFKGFYFKKVYLRHTNICKRATKLVKQTESHNKNAVAKTLNEVCTTKNNLFRNSSVQIQNKNHRSAVKKRLECPLCPKMFRDRWALTRHLKVHYKEQNMCNISKAHSSKVPHIHSSSQKITDSDGSVNQAIRKVINETTRETRNKCFPQEQTKIR